MSAILPSAVGEKRRIDDAELAHADPTQTKKQRHEAVANAITDHVTAVVRNHPVFHSVGRDQRMEVDPPNVEQAAKIAGIFTSIVLDSFYNTLHAPSTVEQKRGELYRCAAQLGDPESLFQEGKRLQKIGWTRDSLDHYLRAAARGHIEAMIELALQYQSENNSKMAFEWMQKAADAKHPKGQFHLGMFYMNGDGVQKDLLKAFEYFQMSANQEDASAQNELGRAYQHGNGVDADPLEAFKWYQMSAKQGNMCGQYNLAHCYGNGIGTAKDPDQRFIWVKKSAEQGLASAQNELGFLYDLGVGTAVNPQLAVKWYQEAAAKGVRAAQYNLGLCYQRGEGIEKNLMQAFAWLKKSADKGDEDGMYEIALCYENGLGVERNLEQAYAWLIKAAQKNVGYAEYKLGIYFLQGIHVQKDPKTAFDYFQKGADHKCPDAGVELGKCFEKGVGTDPDPIRAVACYTEAANAGNTKGRYHLGLSHLHGITGTVDLKAAKTCFRTAAEKHYGPAEYEYSRLIKKKDTKGTEMLRRAASRGVPEAVQELYAPHRDRIVVIQALWRGSQFRKKGGMLLRRNEHRVIKQLRSRRGHTVDAEVRRLERCGVLSQEIKAKMISAQFSPEVQVVLGQALELKQHYRNTHYVFTHAQAGGWSVLSDLKKALLRLTESGHNLQMFKILGEITGTHPLRHPALSANGVSEGDFDLHADAYLWNQQEYRSLYYLTHNTNQSASIKAAIRKQLPTEFGFDIPPALTDEICSLADRRQLETRIGSLCVICVPKEQVNQPSGITIKAYDRATSSVPSSRLQELQDDNLHSGILDVSHFILNLRELHPAKGHRVFRLSPLAKEKVREYKREVQYLAERMYCQNMLSMARRQQMFFQDQALELHGRAVEKMRVFFQQGNTRIISDILKETKDRSILNTLTDEALIRVCLFNAWGTNRDDNNFFYALLQEKFTSGTDEFQAALLQVAGQYHDKVLSLPFELFWKISKLKANFKADFIVLFKQYVTVHKKDFNHLNVNVDYICCQLHGFYRLVTEKEELLARYQNERSLQRHFDTGLGFGLHLEWVKTSQDLNDLLERGPHLLLAGLDLAARQRDLNGFLSTAFNSASACYEERCGNLVAYIETAIHDPATTVDSDPRFTKEQLLDEHLRVFKNIRTREWAASHVSTYGVHPYASAEWKACAIKIQSDSRFEQEHITVSKFRAYIMEKMPTCPSLTMTAQELDQYLQRCVTLELLVG